MKINWRLFAVDCGSDGFISRWKPLYIRVGAETKSRVWCSTSTVVLAIEKVYVIQLYRTC